MPANFTPTEVSNLSGIAKIAADGAQTFALGSDGVLKVWGNNNSGMLGVPGTFQSSPFTMTTLAGVSVIGLGSFVGLAVSSTAVPAGETVTDDLAVGETVTTDENNDGVSPQDPVDTSVTTPGRGRGCKITEEPGGNAADGLRAGGAQHHHRGAGRDRGRPARTGLRAGRLAPDGRADGLLDRDLPQR